MSMHGPEDQPAATLVEARAQAEETREELADTIEALAAKADVKARAHAKAHELTDRAAAAGQALTERAEPRKLAVIAVGAALLGIAVGLWRRR